MEPHWIHPSSLLAASDWPVCLCQETNHHLEKTDKWRVRASVGAYQIRLEVRCAGASEDSAANEPIDPSVQDIQYSRIRRGLLRPKATKHVTRASEEPPQSYNPRPILGR